MRLVKTVQMFKALADRTRLRILNLLTVRELTGTEIADALRLPRSTIARHLRYLYRSQWILPRHDANEAHYSIRPDKDQLARQLVDSALAVVRGVEGMAQDRRKAPRA
jgi:ArsR family transcriptional regulator, arsenate/arsenite/antimonite-responsive transcriptional repressor